MNLQLPFGFSCIVALSLTLALDADLISNFTLNIVRTKQAVILGCSETVLHNVGKNLMHWNQPSLLGNFKRNFSLRDTLTRWHHAKTSVVIDCSCQKCKSILEKASDGRYFNKTYQWLIWDLDNQGLYTLIGDLPSIGPNSQITFVNHTENGGPYSLYDVHSKGRHLNAPLEVVHYADWKDTLTIYHNIQQLQGIQHRDQFNGATLRAGTVIDRDNITTNEQMESLLSSQLKQDGVAAFTKYHYDLLRLSRERFNFTTNCRNERGWAGRLAGGQYRLGFLGIVTRNEIDIGASGAFNRINRFAEFDIVHQSWKFDAAFLYRFTTDLDADGKTGNFLAPFNKQVWRVSAVTIVVVLGLWRLIASFKSYEVERETILLRTCAAVCQQGMESIPRGLPARTIVLTLFVASLVMYNFYTSSVVGGLLSSSGQGPKTIAEIVDSPLKLSFEDIGYYKILFKQQRLPIIKRMYLEKVLPKRGSDDLPTFTHLQQAIPYVKKGGYSFHCELVDAYPEIARLFNADEVCDLRVVSGLLETTLMNWVVTKNSIYTELLRILLCRARETGIVTRTLKVHRPEQPRCQSGYTVYPVNISGVKGAFAVLGGGMLLALIVFGLETIVYRKKKRFS